MKRLLLTLLLMLCLTNLMTVSASADNAIKIYLDGEEMHFTTQPYILNKTIMVPLREIFEQCHSVVRYTKKESMIQIYPSYSVATIFLDGSKPTTIGSREVILYKPIQTRNGKVFVPLSFVAEVVCQNISYDEKTKIAKITKRCIGGWYNDTINRISIKLMDKVPLSFYGCDPAEFGGKKTQAPFFGYLEDTKKPITACLSTFCFSAANKEQCDEVFQKELESNF